MGPDSSVELLDSVCIGEEDQAFTNSMQKINYTSAPTGAWKCYFPPISEIKTDRPTDQSTDRLTYRYEGRYSLAMSIFIL